MSEIKTIAISDVKNRSIKMDDFYPRSDAMLFVISDPPKLRVWFPNSFKVSVIYYLRKKKNKYVNELIFETILMDNDENIIYDSSFGYSDVKRFCSIEELVEELIKLDDQIERKKQAEVEKPLNLLNV